MSEEPKDEIVPNCNRRLQKRRKRHNLFGKRRRAIFLEHLAATCNVQASAAAAGVAVSTVYANRMRDADFRADWQAALEQGYARLEAALIERAMRGERREIKGDRIVEGPDSPAEIDWEKGMELLRHHQRGLMGTARHNPAHMPKRAPIDRVTEKLVRKLRALGVRPEGEA